MEKRTKYTPNEIIDCNTYYEICLYNIKCEEVARTKINKEDLEKAKRYKWYFNDNGYAICKNKKIKIRLHQLILGKKAGYIIDHINHNKLDNRKENLRFATKSQNAMNRKSKGITWNKNLNKWHARVMINYRQIHLGYFDNKQDAIKARRKGEKKYFKTFAYI